MEISLYSARFALFLLVFAIARSPAAAQQNVSQTEKPSGDAAVIRFFPPAGPDVEYICTALGYGEETVWARDAASSRQPKPEPGLTGNATLTSIAVAANVATFTFSAAHGLYIGAAFYVTGATVDADLNIGPLAHGNRSWYKVATVPSGTTLTAASVSVADGTYTEAGLRVTTRAPRENTLVWAIRKLFRAAIVTADMPALGQGGMDKSCNQRDTYF